MSPSELLYLSLIGGSNSDPDWHNGIYLNATPHSLPVWHHGDSEEVRRGKTLSTCPYFRHPRCPRFEAGVGCLLIDGQVANDEAPHVCHLCESSICSKSQKEDIREAEQTPILDLIPRFQGSTCPRSVNVSQKVDGCDTGRVVRAPCRSRNCPVCGNIWFQQRQLWYSNLFRQHMGAGRGMYYAVIRIEDWPKLRRWLHDRGGDYLGVKTSHERMEVFALRSFDGSEYVPHSERLVSKALLQAAKSDVKKPILSSKDWSLPDFQALRKAEKQGTDNADAPEWKTCKVWRGGNIETLVKALQIGADQVEVNEFKNGDAVVSFKIRSEVPAELLFGVLPWGPERMERVIKNRERYKSATAPPSTS